MVQSSAATVEQYLEELPEDRRPVVAAVRDLIRRHLPEGFEEGMGWGMICYSVPLERYPGTYNGQPLGAFAVASQKNYISLYALSVYGHPEQEAWLAEQFAEAGKKLNMGKSCIRFRRLDDLPLPAIAELVSQVTPEVVIAHHEAAHGKARSK